MTTASALIERARSLADLVNSKFITYSDEYSSLNESYRDIYSWLCNNDDDYFVKEYITTLVPNITNDPLNALVDLPEDFYKLRFIDYQYQGYWNRVRKYSTEARDNVTIAPQYRFYGNQLRVIGLNPNGANGNLRLTYYPPAEVLTLPEYAFNYGTSIAPYNKSLVNAPNYTAQGNSLIYVYNGTSIRVESVDNSTVSNPVTIYTGTGLSGVQYYKGYVYFLTAGEIWRGTSDLVATMIPTAITATTGAITAFSISNGKILYSTATETRLCDLNGTNDVIKAAHASTQMCLIGTTLAYISASNQVILDTTVLASDASYLTSDGVSLYYVKSTTNELHKISLTALFTLDLDEPIRENVVFVGSYSNFRLPIVGTDDSIQAISTIPDSELSYPLNEVNEIIAYQCAIDFKRKQNADFTSLTTRMAELQRRFLDVMRRDEGLPQKIGNAYSQTDSTWR